MGEYSLVVQLPTFQYHNAHWLVHQAILGYDGFFVSVIGTLSGLFIYYFMFPHEMFVQQRVRLICFGRLSMSRNVACDL